jgi:hypothetical protein
VSGVRGCWRELITGLCAFVVIKSPGIRGIKKAYLHMLQGVARFALSRKTLNLSPPGPNCRGSGDLFAFLSRKSVKLLVLELITRW